MTTATKTLMNGSRPIGEYVPVTAHTSPHNVRLKGGAMATVIQLVGASHEAADDDDLQAWHDALKGLIRNIVSEGVAFWTHLVREPRSHYPAGEFADDFAGQLNEHYRDSLKGLSMMVNSHYLTIIVQGKSRASRLFDFRSKRTVADASVDQQEQNERLDELAGNVLAGLSRYGARRLEMYEHNGLVCSEVLEFYSFLLTGERQRVAVPKGSAQYSLCNARVSFGVDQFEIRTVTGVRLGAMTAIAEYQVETTEPGHLDIALTLPFPFVLTQSFSGYSKAKALSALSKQQKLLVNAGDAAVSQIEGIGYALDDLMSNRSVYGEHHLSLSVMAVSAKELNQRLAIVRSVLSDGFLAVREDECLEAAFAAQLPGCFRWRPRPALISSGNFACFTGFHNYPSGRAEGNQWGPAITLLKTTSGTPFYFNFHLAPTSRKGIDQNNVDDRVAGHTLILGPTGAGKTVIQAFMLAQCEKYKPTVFTFDKDQGQEIFIRAQGGRYNTLKNGVPTGFNPCALPDTPGNRVFLTDLVKRCIRGDDTGFRFSSEREQEVHEAIDGLYRLPHDARRFRALIQFFDPTAVEGNAQRFRRWCEGGQLGWLLDNPTDNMSLSGCRHFGFDVTDFLENDDTRTVTVMYLFHRMQQLLDGRRFIMNMDEFWRLLLDPYFEGKALDAVKTWRKLNALAVFGTQSPADVLQSRVSRQLIEQCVSQLYLPNSKALWADYGPGGFNLSTREFEIISQEMVENRIRGFFFKQGANATVCELNLAGFDDELAVLSGTKSLVELCEQARRVAGEDPRAWLPVFQPLRRNAA